MDPNEQVLTFPRKILDDLGAFDGMRLDHSRYLDAIFSSGALKFVPRQSAENDYSLKQIIPYVLIVAKGKVLFYVRGKKTGETRLRSKGSVGIGGHINMLDETLFMDRGNVFREIYDAAVQREVDEEITIKDVKSKRIVGVINDDSTDVGKVHFGVVHLWELGSEEVSKSESAITQLQFLDAKGILSDPEIEVESWSRFCLEKFDEVLIKT